MPLSLLFSGLDSPSSLLLLGDTLHIFVALTWTLSSMPTSLALGSPKLDAVLQVQPHQCTVEGKDCLPQPAGNALPNAAS